jgi:hypothetical protein
VAYNCWNHCGIRFEGERGHFRVSLSHLIGHDLPVDVEGCLNVTVPHETLLHSDGSPNSIEPRAVRVPEAVRPQTTPR